MVQAFGRQRQAHQAAAVAGHEIDRLGRDLGGSHGQIALVLAVLVVHHDDHPAGANRHQRVLDRRERALAPCALGHSHCAPLHHRCLNPSTARATYFPTISHSRLTRSPARKDDKFVCRQVQGTIMTSKRAASSRATVRLTPLRAIDPFETTRCASAAGSSTPIQWASPSASTRSTATAASTWPCTRWPPRRVSARAARSRLTACEGRTALSVVT